MSISSGPISLLSIYAPTICSTSEAKDQFYEALDDAISRIPSTEGPYMLRDFNVRVEGDSEAWTACFGHHGIARIIDNGQNSRVVMSSQTVYNNDIYLVQGAP